MDTTSVEPVDAEIDPTVPSAEPEEAGSLADHEAAFIAPPQPEGDEPPARHRATSQRAKPDDVAAIAAQTKRLREAEAAIEIAREDGESDRVYNLRRRAVIAERARTPAPAVATTTAARPAAPVVATPVVAVSARPDPGDAKYIYGTADPQFLLDLTQWQIDTAMAARDTKQADEAKRSAAAAEWKGIVEAFQSQIAVSMADPEMPDFKAIALDRDTPIPQGSLVDLWIWRKPARGQKVLYYLHQPAHAQELTTLLQQDAETQLETLTLLGQRLSTPRTPDASTGSPAAPVRSPGPRPPNPVRTGPMRTTDEPPGDGASLAEHERAFSRPRR